MARDREPVATGRRLRSGVKTPPLISPPESKTPPTALHKRHQSDISDTQTPRAGRNSEPVDASTLRGALEHLEQAGRVRDRTPTTSPKRKRARIHGDR